MVMLVLYLTQEIVFKGRERNRHSREGSTDTGTLVTILTYKHEAIVSIQL